MARIPTGGARSERRPDALRLVDHCGDSADLMPMHAERFAYWHAALLTYARSQRQLMLRISDNNLPLQLVFNRS